MRQPENEEQLVELENAVEEAKAKILPSLLDEYEAGCPGFLVSIRPFGKGCKSFRSP